MPCYPALALLLGCALESEDGWLKWGWRMVAVVAALAAAATLGVGWMVRNMAAPGDIASALNQHPELYTLSLGHMLDLTLSAFAYLKLPLAVAGIAFLIGAAGAWRKRTAMASTVVMMIVFFHAARLALVVFDPYLASRPLADALNRAPHGKLILDDQYYTFSSVVFYAEAYHGERVLLLNGRVNNLQYGSYAPDAPRDVFIDDNGFRDRWRSPDRYYICVEKPRVAALEALVGPMHEVVESGGKFVFTNR